MRALVVGGSGFIGSHVVDALLSKNFTVRNIDLTRYEPAVNEYNYSYSCVDIVDRAAISCVVTDFRPDVVYNFAAVASIAECNKYPLYAIEKNVIGHVNVLQGVADYVGKQLDERPNYHPWVPLVVFASSVYVYNERSGFYGTTKNACEMFTRCYAQQYRFPYVLLRYGTVYGPRASKGNSIKALLENALKTKVLSYYGTGEEVREYIHVKDVAAVSIDIVEKTSLHNCPVMVSSPCPVKASDMLRMLRDILGEEYKVEFRGEKVFDHYDVTPYSYSPDVARKYIGESYYDLGAGLLELIREGQESQR